MAPDLFPVFPVAWGAPWEAPRALLGPLGPHRAHGGRPPPLWGPWGPHRAHVTLRESTSGAGYTCIMLAIVLLCYCDVLRFVSFCGAVAMRCALWHAAICDGDKCKLHRKVPSRSDMSRKCRYLRGFRTFNPGK